MRVLPRCLAVLGLPKTAVSSRRGKLDGRVATSYGPKVFREAASLLSLGAERKVGVVGEGLAPPAAPTFHYLPVELPAVFAVLFEAAKSKFPQCSSRVRLAKRGSVLRVAREDSGDM